MKPSRYERTQKANPHKLTVNQHVFPAASLKRFEDETGRLDLYDRIRGIRRPALRKDVAFCAKRAWSHREETGFMRQIEAAFQPLVEKILTGDVQSFNEDQNSILNEFFALWYMRARHRYLDKQEIQANGITGENLTKDQEEILERKGYAFARKGGKFLARQLNGMQLQIKTGRYAEDIKSTVWGIIRLQEGEILIPDVPSHSIIPLTPILCLVANSSGGFITKDNLAQLNYAVREASQEYFFAKNLKCCPIASTCRVLTGRP